MLDAGGFLRGPQSAYVALLDLDAPNHEKPWLAAVLNAGDSIPAVLSPGAIVSLYVSAAQINAILPFDLGDDPMVQVVVERDGVRGSVFAMTVVEAAPGPFQQAPPNASLGAILNQDGTLNSPANPAPAGSVVSLWASGLGPFSPPLSDGETVGITGPLPELELEVSVQFGEIQAEIRYAGAAPGLAAGIAQINFVVPPGLSSGSVPVRIRAGERQSYPFTYIAVRP